MKQNKWANLPTSGFGNIKFLDLKVTTKTAVKY